MEQIEIVAYKRQKKNTNGLKKIRFDQANVPGVLYGKGLNELFSVPAILLKDLIYSNVPKLINFNLEGFKCNCIFKEAQFHPVSEMILHVDFMKVEDDQDISVCVPIRINGLNNCVGVKKGGLFLKKLKKIPVIGSTKDIPNSFEIDVTDLDAGKTLRIENALSQYLSKLKINLDLKTPIVEIKAAK